LCDGLGALLLITAVFNLKKLIIKTFSNKIFIALVFAGILMAVDVIAATTCKTINGRCIDQPSIWSYIHGIESIVLGVLFTLINLYDVRKRKKIISTLMLIFQVIYGIIFVSGVFYENNLATFGQYAYQLLTIIWLAWLTGSIVPVNKRLFSANLRKIFALWAFLNGILSIVISLAHVHIFEFFNDIYIANNSYWLSQHGVVTGIIMIYLSLHLSRGEARARIIILILLFLEILKYSTVSTHPLLLIYYLLMFVGLFVLKDTFRRGVAKISIHDRLQEMGVVISGGLAALTIIFIILSTNKVRLDRTLDALKHYGGYTYVQPEIQEHLHHSHNVSKMISSLIILTILLAIWSLFRPIKSNTNDESKNDRKEIFNILKTCSRSSEDFFKFWPNDKKYFFNHNRSGFIAYKESRSVIFALADPIAKNTYQQKKLIEEFCRIIEEKSFRVCFLMAGEDSINLYENSGLNIFQIGSSAVVNNKKFVEETIKNKWWRWQNNRAIKSGYEYNTSQSPHTEDFLNKLKYVSDKWLERPGRSERGFALGYFDKSYMNECVIHYLKNSEGQIIAFANSLPSFSNTRASIDLMRFLPEYNNAMTYLLSSIIRSLDSQKFDEFDLGFVPLANINNRLITFAKSLASKRFSAKGLEQFKNKFEPKWEKNYIAYSGDITDLAPIAINLEDSMKIQKN
jgi:phosphatidylglycerol lysyltransferase